MGALAAMIGIWMFHAPAGGTLTLFFWEFDVATMAEAVMGPAPGTVRMRLARSSIRE